MKPHDYIKRRRNRSDPDYTDGRGMAHYIAETLARFDVNLVRVQPIAQKE